MAKRSVGKQKPKTKHAVREENIRSSQKRTDGERERLLRAAQESAPIDRNK